MFNLGAINPIRAGQFSGIVKEFNLDNNNDTALNQMELRQASAKMHDLSLTSSSSDFSKFAGNMSTIFAELEKSLVSGDRSIDLNGDRKITYFKLIGASEVDQLINRDGNDAVLSREDFNLAQSHQVPTSADQVFRAPYERLDGVDYSFYTNFPKNNLPQVRFHDGGLTEPGFRYNNDPFQQYNGNYKPSFRQEQNPLQQLMVSVMKLLTQLFSFSGFGRGIVD